MKKVKLRMCFISLLSLLLFATASFGFSVISHDPSSNEEAVSISTNIATTFDANVSTDVLTINFDASIEVHRIKDNMSEDVFGTERITGEGSINGPVLTFNPFSDLTYGSRYRVLITTAVEDAVGNHTASNYTWFFNTIYSAAEENAVIASDDRTKVSLPANTLPSNGFVDINMDPLTSHTLSADLSAAEAQIIGLGDPYLYPINATMKEFVVYEGQSTLYGDQALNGQVTVDLPFENNNGDRYVDNTDPPILVDNLTMYYLDTESNKWMPIAGPTIYEATNVVSSRVSRLSIFVLMGHMSPGLKDSYAFPVPFMPNDNPNHTNITFTKLLPYSKIRIYTSTAKEVIELNADYLGSDIHWDTRNSAGNKVASGVYIYHIQLGGDSNSNKLIIIR
ncbi:MAG: Ig-like domain-containing protein [bacterium]